MTSNGNLQTWIISQYDSYADLRLDFTNYAASQGSKGVLINSTASDITVAGTLVPAGKIVFNSETADISEIYNAVSNADDILIRGTSGDDWVDLSKTFFDMTEFEWSAGNDYYVPSEQGTGVFTPWNFSASDSVDGSQGLTIDNSSGSLDVTSHQGVFLAENIGKFYDTQFSDVFLGSDADNAFKLGQGGADVVTGNGGSDRFRVSSRNQSNSDFSGYSATITDYETLEEISLEDFGFDGTNWENEYSVAFHPNLDETHISISTQTYDVASVVKIRGEYGLYNSQIEEDGDIELYFVSAELLAGVVINGTDDGDRLYGYSGNDTINGLQGDDWLYGGLGDDYLDNGSGDDFIYGEDGNDTFINWSGTDHYDGGSGNDTIITDLSAERISGIMNSQSFEIYLNLVNEIHGLPEWSTAPDTVINVENYTLLGDFNAELIGDGKDNILKTDLADDNLYGGAGDDTLNGGSGDDIFDGGAGDDTISLESNGTFGSELYAYNTTSLLQTGTEESINLDGKTRFGDVMDGGADVDTVELTDSSDAFFLHDSFGGFHSSLTLVEDYDSRLGAARIANIENITSGAGDDIVDLTSPDYSLAGQSITVDGGSGNDTLWGSDANETLLGGDGNDELFGGAGTNVLTGGAGADEFQFTKSSTNDTVKDFSPSDGDTLKFFNTGGAQFDRGSVSLTGDVLSISDGTGVLTITLEGAGLQLDDLGNDVLIIG